MSQTFPYFTYYLILLHLVKVQLSCYLEINFVLVISTMFTESAKKQFISKLKQYFFKVNAIPAEILPWKVCTTVYT